MERTSHTLQILIIKNFLSTSPILKHMDFLLVNYIDDQHLNNLQYSLKLLISDFEMPVIKFFIPGGTLKENGALHRTLMLGN